MLRAQQEARWLRQAGRVWAALLTLMLFGSRAWAQQPSTVSDSLPLAAPQERSSVRRATYSRMVVPATLGALVGSVAGGVGGAVLGLGEGEYAPLEGALVYGVAGGVLGSVTGAWLRGRGPGELKYGQAWIAGGVGFLGGLAGSWALYEVSGEGLGWWYVGLVIGQGVVTAAVASLLAR